MQLSMCDTGDAEVKKNTTNNNQSTMLPTLLLIMSRGMAFMCDTWMTRVAAFLCDSLVILPHPYGYVKRFLIKKQIFLNIFSIFFPYLSNTQSGDA